MSLPRNFAELDPLEKRKAVEKATGLTWAEYEKLPGDTKVTILLQLQGMTYTTGTDDMLTAARKDSFFSYLRGLGGGVQLALVVGIVVVVALAFPRIKKAIS
jgi:hypothetical protein